MTEAPLRGFDIREATVRDGDAIRALIGGVYREYGWRFDIGQPEERHLREPHAWFADRGGVFWTAWDGADLAATCAVWPRRDEAELKSLYVHRAYRRRGLGRGLTRRAIGFARAAGATRFVLWSDVMLTDAHRLYLSMGFSADRSRWVEAIEPYAEAGFSMPLV